MVKGIQRIVLYTCVLVAAMALTSQAADKPQFTLPIDCTPAQDCWTVNYVDMDPTDSAASDFTCGPRSYDTHKGTDFALRHLGDVKRGVNVLAAMDGTVARFRDSEPDTLKTKAQMDAISEANKDCGNGILIDHASAGFQGLQTMYCHLKQGSVSVKKGQSITAGDVIAQVGQSGVAEFPHVHFSVFWEGAVIDPYTGAANTKGCGQFKKSLWDASTGDALPYEPFAIYDGGFTGKIPDFDAVKRGEYDAKIAPQITTGAKAFIFWGGFYGVREGDVITLTVQNPEKKVILNRTITQDKTRARQFYFTGRKTVEAQLVAGRYDGIITLSRKNVPQQKKAFSVTVGN